MSKELSTQNYIAYMNKVKDLEVSCFQQQRLCDGLNDRIKKCTNNVAVWSQEVSAPRPKRKKTIGRSVGHLFMPIVIGILGAMIGVALWYISLLMLFIPSFLFDFDLDWWSEHSEVMAIICALLGVIITIWIRTSDDRDTKKQYLSDIQKYDNMQKQLQPNIISAKQMIPELRSKLQTSQQLLLRTRRILQDTYNMDYIYPKYRNIVAICTILEYLESGRCASLTGANGAYNLYENELRANIIIGKLSDIGEKLDQISDNQHLLADVVSSSVKRTNRILNSMQGTLRQISQNTEYTQYYSQVTAQNTAFLSWAKSFEMIHNS